jgi:hypothetical protein
VAKGGGGEKKGSREQESLVGKSPVTLKAIVLAKRAPRLDVSGSLADSRFSGGGARCTLQPVDAACCSLVYKMWIGNACQAVARFLGVCDCKTGRITAEKQLQISQLTKRCHTSYTTYLCSDESSAPRSPWRDWQTSVEYANGPDILNTQHNTRRGPAEQGAAAW